MTAKLKKYFPMIREKEEVLAEIRKDSTLHTKINYPGASTQAL